jgi:hypothetical protein
MGNSKRALDEIRSAADVSSNAGSDQKKSWYLWLKLKEIKKFWYQCLWRKDPKVEPEQAQKIFDLAVAFSEYEEMKISKNRRWRCPWLLAPHRSDDLDLNPESAS